MQVDTPPTRATAEARPARSLIDQAAVRDDLTRRLTNTEFPAIDVPMLSFVRSDNEDRAAYVLYLFHDEDGEYELHTGFSRLEGEWDAFAVQVVGISAEWDEELAKTKITRGIGHWLIPDPQARLAESLKLPTRSCRDRRSYESLVLVVVSGVVVRVFYPITPRVPWQVLTWLRLHLPAGEPTVPGRAG